MPNREQWFADVLRAGLETQLLTEQDILSHITPTVMTAALPRDVLVRVFDAALGSGSISPKAVVETATLELMAERVPTAIVWRCITTTVDRAGIPDSRPTEERASREFLRRALDAALDTGVLAPKDIVQHVNAQVLGGLPDALAAKLLEVSLATGKMSPTMVIETIGVDAIAQHVATGIMWACLANLGETPVVAAVIEQPVKKPIATLEYVDDDVVSVLVDLEDSADGPNGHLPAAELHASSPTK